MGVTLPTLANGTTMSASTVFGAATTIRDWMNGNAVLGDIGGTMPTRTFKRGDNLTWGGKVQHWMGPSGGYWFLNATDDVSERIIVHPTSHGIVSSGNGQYMDLSEFGLRFKVPDSGYLNVDIDWWCWAIGSNQTVPEAAAVGRQAEFLTFINGVSQAGTRRQLWDSGTDASGTQGGPYIYPARQYAVSARTSILSGWNTVRFKINLKNSTATAQYPTIYIGARSMLVEYERR